MRKTFKHDDAARKILKFIHREIATSSAMRDRPNAETTSTVKVSNLKPTESFMIDFTVSRVLDQDLYDCLALVDSEGITDFRRPLTENGECRIAAQIFFKLDDPEFIDARLIARNENVLRGFALGLRFSNETT